MAPRQLQRVLGLRHGGAAQVPAQGSAATDVIRQLND